MNNMNNINMNNMNPQMMMNFMQMMQMMNNNNMNNNNMNNNMNNMNMNNMNMNNMNMNNINPQMMMNFMQMMQTMNNNNMGNMNNSRALSLVFTQKNKGKKINIQVNSGDLVTDIIKKYRSKTLDNDDSKFIFNGKELKPDWTLNKAGLQDGSEILVISLVNLEGA